MDKGLQGLLTGDLSTYIIKVIEDEIESFKEGFEEDSRKIEEILDKKQSLENYYDENFSLQSE